MIKSTGLIQMHVLARSQYTQRRCRAVLDRRLDRDGANRGHSQERFLLKDRYPAENLVRRKRRAPAVIGFGNSHHTPEFSEISHRLHFARRMWMRGAYLPAWHW